VARQYPVLLLALAISGCSSQRANLGPPLDTAASVRPLHLRATSSTGGNLYVGNSGPVTVYAPGSTSPLRTLKHGYADGGLAFDAALNLFVADREKRLAIFPPGATLPDHYIRRSIDGAQGMVIDPQGRLYVDNYLGSSITVYATASRKFLRKIDVSYSMNDAVDRQGYLYVSWWYGEQGIGVQTYSPGGKKYLYDVFERGEDPMAIGVDSANRLYTTNYDEGTITVYKPHSQTAIRSVSTSVSFPGAVTFDASGNVYCACGAGVTEYTAGLGKRVRAITDGISSPQALVTDAVGNLYVANNYPDSVTVYAPGATEPSETITQGVYFPNALAIGP
jgi:sugar lactone lactonase YvrE